MAKTPLMFSFPARKSIPLPWSTMEATRRPNRRCGRAHPHSRPSSRPTFSARVCSCDHHSSHSRTMMDRNHKSYFLIWTTSRVPRSAKPTSAVLSAFQAVLASLSAHAATETTSPTRTRCFTPRWSSNSVPRRPTSPRYLTAPRSHLITCGSTAKSTSSLSTWLSLGLSCSHISPS